MREILFRGKNKVGGDWVEGFFETTHDGAPLIRSRGLHKWVFADTVGQYTGETDKNGKKVFEGDILKITRKQGGRTKKVKALVKYGNLWEKCAFIVAYKGTAWDYMKDIVDFVDGTKNFEIIGNIHDNPELLEGGGDHE